MKERNEIFFSFSFLGEDYFILNQMDLFYPVFAILLFQIVRSVVVFFKD